MNTLYTYIIKCGQYYKFGKTKDMSQRMKSYAQHNPEFLLLGYVVGNYEQSMRNRFKDAQEKGDWYRLPVAKVQKLIKECKRDLQYIEQNIL